MEFIINNHEFKKAVSEVSRAISYKNNLPILAGIKIEAKSDQLILIGSNSDITIVKTIPVSEELSIEQIGSVVVSAKYLGEIIKKLPSPIHFKASGKQSVRIQSEEITTKLNGFHVEEYPSLPEVKSGGTINISSEELLSTIRQTVFAASKTGTKPALTGVNFLFQGNLLTCIATNSQRLSLRKLHINSDVNGSFIVPSYTLTELVKLFGGKSREVAIITTNSYIVFKTSTASLYSKLIDGNYPNVSSLLSQNFRTEIRLSTKQLLQGIERASVFASDMKNNNITLQIKDEFTIMISSGTSEFGQIEEKQSIMDITNQKELSITFDGNFMVEALQAIEENEVRLCLNGSLRPILLAPVGNDSHLQLVSPVRT
ncbi:DNA polymerase III subunit beta [Paucisalibacillus sp. EB02]|uniref:DNA polymerase III subunit beta n=1 Tax=Paucisalibacillus sp. EB02 TaxID=1347087 RepID=UPI0004BC8D76|nr:DNA polymerase III subunit beta [Paucisalibacillus sp. EB02]